MKGLSRCRRVGHGAVSDLRTEVISVCGGWGLTSFKHKGVNGVTVSMTQSLRGCRHC